MGRQEAGEVLCFPSRRAYARAGFRELPDLHLKEQQSPVAIGGNVAAQQGKAVSFY
jgi:hypothetical protein